MFTLSRAGLRRTIAITGVILTTLAIIHQLSYIEDIVNTPPLSESVELVRSCPHPTSNRPHDSLSESSKRIPNLVHQIWKTKNVSTYSIEASHEAWKAMFEPMNYTVKLWTEDDIVDIVKNKYPWLLSTYQSYSQNIQRADVARLVVLHAEGGMYADLDVHPRSFEAISCLQSLDLQGIFAPTSGALGLSNHFFMAEKGSAFLHWALHEAKRRGGATSKRILLPYLQVFWSTGPLMVTSAYSQYAWAISPTSTEIGVLDEDYGGSVIGHEAGRSWHSADGQILNYLGDNLRLESPWVIVPLLFAILVLLTIIARRYMRGKKSAYLRLG